MDTKHDKTVNYNGIQIQYHFQYKKVKNINLRINSEGTIFVSANRSVTQKTIDAFVLSKGEWILKVLKQHEEQLKKPKNNIFQRKRFKI